MVGILITMVMLVASAPAAEIPDWVSRAKAGEIGWADGEIIFGVGKAPKMANPSLQRDVAGNRARAMLPRAANIPGAAEIQLSEIIDRWETDDGTFYALARVERSNIKPLR